jgi:hypothetical protein
MPGRDGRGPDGKGPLTGRRMGYCKGSEESTITTERPFDGRGRGRGRRPRRGK